MALMAALLAPLRGTHVVLGVRQDLPRYARTRHPGRRWMHAAASVLERAWRLLARVRPVVVVGPELARRYAHAPRMLQQEMSLARVPAGRTDGRRYDGELRILSVGRLEAEKNPLLLAEVLATLRRHDDRWRLLVCGEGPLDGPLRRRLADLGVAEAAELLGYVPVDRGLARIYRDSHVLLHVSWTEGVPQVLFEAWSEDLPVVATAVGGVPETASGAALLIAPGSAEAAAAAVRRLVDDRQLRERLVAAGRERVSGQTMDLALDRLGTFLLDV
jgi:glycosyltransferase involved in cell wall biosynthesis